MESGNQPIARQHLHVVQDGGLEFLIGRRTADFGDFQHDTAFVFMPEVGDEATETTTGENVGESRRSSLKTVAGVKQVGYSSRPRGLPGLLTKDRKLTIHTGSQQLDGGILEKCCRGLMSHHVL